MTRTRWLAVAIALAAVVAVFLWWRGRDRASGEAGGGRAGGGVAGGSSSGGANPGGSAGPGRPARIPGGGPAVSGGSNGTQTYAFDRAVIRDHRGGAAPAPLGPPGLPPDQRTMSPVVTSQIYDQLKPIVRRCGDAVAAADRGSEPFAYVTLTVAVGEGVLRATGVETGVQDVADGAKDAFTTCVREAALQVAIPQSGEPDREDYYRAVSDPAALIAHPRRRGPR